MKAGSSGSGYIDRLCQSAGTVSAAFAILLLSMFGSFGQQAFPSLAIMSGRLLFYSTGALFRICYVGLFRSSSCMGRGNTCNKAGSMR
jgi:hypothetical protein